MTDNNKSIFKWTDKKVTQLIKLIKENEPLYNNKHKDHFKTKMLDGIWSDIDSKLGKPPGFSKAKYNHLRNTFRKEYECCLENECRSSWSFYSHLKFLVPFLRKKSDNNSLDKCLAIALEKYKTEQQTKPSVNKDEEEVQSEHVYEIIEYNSEEIDDDSGAKFYVNHDVKDKIEEVEPSPKKPKTRDRATIKKANITATRAIIKELPPNEAVILTTNPNAVQSSSKPPQNTYSLPQIELQPHSCSCQTDPNAMFLMSLLPDITSMSRKDQGVFKIKIQQLIQDILFKD